MSAPLPRLKRFEIRLSGTGGQGVLTLGRVLGESLALRHGYFAAQTQSYGPEARGGSSRADVVVSSERISYPKAEKLDLLVALSQEACNAYCHALKPGGVLLVDSELVGQPPISLHLGLPFARLAAEEIGVKQAMNSVVLGALTALLPFADRDLTRESLRQALPAKVVEVNVKAFELGYAKGRAEFGPSPEIWARAEAGAAALAEEDTTILSGE